MKCINGEYQRENGGAAMAVIQDEKVIYEETKHFENTTNNYCELYAILMALKYFKKEQPKDILKIYSDSAYCVNMLKSGGWIYSWAKNGWTRGKKHEPIENLEIIKEIYRYLEKSKNIEFIKVKGHSGEKDWNDYVDKLAVKAKMEI
jgi:ribonuclease HI